MKMIKLAIILLLISSCGQMPNTQTERRVYSDTGAVCTVEQLDEGAKVTCPDGTEALISNGEAGTNGEDGKNGEQCSVESAEEGVRVICGDYEQVIYHGEGCWTEDTDTGAKIVCPDSESTLDNGADGAVGKRGARGKAGVDGIDGENVHDKLIYEGYACSRTVVSLGGVFYVFHGQLIQLTDKWFEISGSCSLRIKDGQIEVQ